MDIVFVTTAETDAEAKALMKLFDIPFAGEAAARQPAKAFRRLSHSFNGKPPAAPRSSPAGS